MRFYTEAEATEYAHELLEGIRGELEGSPWGVDTTELKIRLTHAEKQTCVWITFWVEGEEAPTAQVAIAFASETRRITLDDPIEIPSYKGIWLYYDVICKEAETTRILSTLAAPSSWEEMRDFLRGLLQ